MMINNIFVWGLNFKTAPIDYREKLACSNQETPYLLRVLKSIEGVHELVILSTCNRVEIYAHLEGEEVLKDLVDNFLELKGVEKDKKRYSFTLRGKDAVFHIFKVASSLDSMVVGETQITSQFKQAFSLARETGTLGKILNRLYQWALKTAKRVRNQTGISKNAVSVSYVAVELAKKIFGDLRKAKVLLVGAGEMGELASRYLQKHKASIFITNRTYEKAVELAQKLGGNALRFDNLKDYLHEFDVIILSTGAKDYILTKDVVSKAIKQRNYKPMFIIDISVPRNAEPSINELDEVFLYNVDDLKTIADKNLSERWKEREKAEIIAWDEVEKFARWVELLEVEDYIKKIKACWREVEAKEPMVRRLIHAILEEIKKNPDSAPKWYKILVEEVKDGDALRRIPSVYNRAYGA